MTPDRLTPDAAAPVLFEGCFGWLHPAAGRRGVVLCAPYGGEALATHRPWRGFARALAAAGLPVLRFDYPGTGNSAGDEDDPARLEAWLDGIRAAAAHLRAVAGVEEVALVGLRLGGLLAAAAARRAAADALVLLSPFPSGRAFLQELRAVALLADRPPGAPSAVGPEGIDSAGFRLSLETAEALRGLDLARLTEAPAPRVLVLDRPEGRAAAVAERFRALGAAVEEAPFPDHARLMTSVQHAASDCSAFARAAAWLSSDTPPAGTASTAHPPERPLRLAGAVERPLRFGDGAGLFGILCEPDTATAAGRPAVLLLNSGATPHSGTGRMSVRLARRLATRGIASLRMDLGGLGDSASKPGRRDGLIYCRDMVEDAQAGLDALAAAGHGAAVAVGLCAGAAVALHVALADPRVVGLALVNPGRFVLGDGATQEEAIGSAVKPAAAYLPRLTEPAVWRAILRKDRKASRVARGLSERAARRLRIGAGRLRAGLTGRGYARDDVLHAFQALSERGVRTLMVHSAGDVTLGELEAQAGVDGGRLRRMGGLWMERLAGADHSLMERAARERFAELLDDLLDRIGAGGTGTVRGKGPGPPEGTGALRVNHATGSSPA
ncbi:serine aminopeptidase S33 family [Azospirillum brasilense]|uniref:Serine aminopeptidase S33 family n=1 Tax=Azospirillum brasilense TaxID=192 RepID=A0A560BIP1_AZOBR|nr:alpha/beta fold hydrolase [Azospirillum brasilense]TWA72467.1 serine aminopeptidase S33 family [Azospirillum brasilense]